MFSKVCWYHFTFLPAMYGGSDFSTSSPHLLDPLVLDILVGMEWCFAVDSVCISLMANGIKHLFVYILAICINSLDTIQIPCSFLFKLSFYY